MLPGRELLLLWRNEWKGCEAGDCGAKCRWRKAGRRESKAVLPSHASGVEPSPQPLPPHLLASAAELERGWPIKCLSH